MDLFHRHRQANEHGLAAAALERALQIPEYRPEACIWNGIEALPRDPKLAFIFFSDAADALPQRADVHALIGRSLLAQGLPALASRYLTEVWKQMPDDVSLRMMLWQARSQAESPESLRRIILAELPYIAAPNELALVLKLIAAQPDSPGLVGVVRFIPDLQEIQGWAVDLHNLQTAPSLQLEANGKVMNTIANSPHTLLAAAGLPVSHGGIRIKVPHATPAVSVRFESGPPLLGSPVFAMPAFAPPPSTTSGCYKPLVDVLIPVFDGLEETLECINSALTARKLNRTPHRLVVIEDATPLPALRKALKILANKSKITLVQNIVNLGFIRSMNRAMALSPTQDVVWLNADTRVHGDWLDRLRRVAYSDETIASVTPFTNNGELMSFPVSRVSHAMPSAQEQAELDELARQVNAPPVEIETGCGFCLYIKRDAINQVGYLDEVHLLRGYGEETDWCLRARSLGWRHMGAPGVFVAHEGGISFGSEKTLRVAHNNAILKRRYPDAPARFDTFCLRDPIKPARQVLQRARLTRFLEQVAAGRHLPAVDLRALCIHKDDALKAPVSLAWRREGTSIWATLKIQIRPLPLDVEYALPEDLPSLLRDLQQLPFDELVFQQLAGCPAELCDLPAQLEKPYRVVCQDDQILCSEDAYDWQRFAREASSIQLPWTELHHRFAAATTHLTYANQTPACTYVSEPTTPDVLLIGDDLHDAKTAKEWVAIARRITREQLPLRLIAKDDGPWFKTLLTTGAVHPLPKLRGLTLAERTLAVGCNAVVSLDLTPGAGWRGPDLAAQVRLPLYTLPGPLADEVGAFSINILNTLPSPA